jgi:hypothetical protein
VVVDGVVVSVLAGAESMEVVVLSFWVESVGVGSSSAAPLEHPSANTPRISATPMVRRVMVTA